MDAIIAWVIAHQVVLAVAAVGLLDLVFALVPSWQSNGILHFIYLQIKNLIPKGNP